MLEMNPETLTLPVQDSSTTLLSKLVVLLTWQDLLLQSMTLISNLMKLYLVVPYLSEV